MLKHTFDLVMLSRPRLGRRWTSRPERLRRGISYWKVVPRRKNRPRAWKRPQMLQR